MPAPPRERFIVPAVRDPEEVLAATLLAIREDLSVPGAFPDDVLAEAALAVESVELPEVDATDIPFVTIDPEGATDLDQAVHIARDGDGYLVHYAIADLPAFVRPGGAVDAEARTRGTTLYAPDVRVPLHPPIISEGAASLLPEQVSGAFVWRFAVDAAGEVTSVGLTRARVRSREQLSYVGAQAALDSGTASDVLQLVAEVGALRIELERERGGASLDRPEEEVVRVDGRYELVRASAAPIENFNAQISLMTGMAAAKIMLDARVGILRTMPPPPEEATDRFRRQVAALGCPWPQSIPYGEYLRGLDRADPRGLAAIHAAASLFRGAGYTVFDGELPEQTVQAAVAAPYAHTTAPLRRLVDRFVLVLCESLVNGRTVPEWVRQALPTLPKLMSAADSLASRVERASVDAIEAALLTGREGEEFDAVVVTAKDASGTVQIADPVVTATVDGAVTAGANVRVRLVAADIPTGEVRFTLA